jgi:hypothetical protein
MLHLFDNKNYTRAPENSHRLSEINVETLHKEFGYDFWKLSDDSDGRMGVRYKTGLNIDPKPFKPEGNAQGGGLYFFSSVQLIFLKYNWFIPFKVKYIRRVTFEGNAANARIWVEDRKFKANKCIYGSREEYSGRATDYVNWLNYDACLRAVREDTYPCVLKFVSPDLRTKELCELTVAKHPRSFKYVPELHQSMAMMTEVISKDPSQIRFCKNPPDSIIKLAFDKDNSIMKYLK